MRLIPLRILSRKISHPLWDVALGCIAGVCDCVSQSKPSHSAITSTDTKPWTPSGTVLQQSGSGGVRRRALLLEVPLLLDDAGDLVAHELRELAAGALADAREELELPQGHIEQHLRGAKLTSAEK